MKIDSPIYFFCFMLFLAACAYNKVEIVPGEDLGPPISYDLEVKPIIVANCYQCHSDGATDPDAAFVPPDAHWDHFDQLQHYALDPDPVAVGYTRISARINHVGNTPYMPMDLPKLSDSDIEKIDRWIRQGALNN